MCSRDSDLATVAPWTATQAAWRDEAPQPGALRNWRRVRPLGVARRSIVAAKCRGRPASRPTVATPRGDCRLAPREPHARNQCPTTDHAYPGIRSRPRSRRRKRRSPQIRSCSGCRRRGRRSRPTRTGQSIIMSTRSPRSTIPTVCASGRETGISSIRPIRRKIRANIGATPCHKTSCIGATSPTASIPTPKRSAFPARHWSRTTGSSPCTSARRSATWWLRRAIRCCSTGPRLPTGR